jgi:hypothetical protein
MAEPKCCYGACLIRFTRAQGESALFAEAIAAYQHLAPQHANDAKVLRNHADPQADHGDFSGDRKSCRKAPGQSFREGTEGLPADWHD